MAKEAAKRSNKDGLSRLNNREDIQHVSSTDLYRLVQFVLVRESDGLSAIQTVFDPSLLEDFAHCSHCEDDAQDYYLRLQKAVQEAFVKNPCMGAEDLSSVLDGIPDPPLGCDPPPRSAAWYSEGAMYDSFSCPLRPMTIRVRLREIADDLCLINDRLMAKFFEKDFGSG